MYVSQRALGAWGSPASTMSWYKIACSLGRACAVPPLSPERARGAPFRKRVESKLIERVAWELLADADRFTRLPMIAPWLAPATSRQPVDRKSTRLNSSHGS